MSTATELDREFDLTDREIYAHWTVDTIRFADLDTLGHVNNVAFSTFFESGRVRFFRDAEAAVDSPEGSWMAVRLCVDFRAQLGYPGAINIGSRITRIGRSSMTIGAGLFSGNAEKSNCVATAECIMVLVDLATNRSTEVPAHMRKALLAQNPDQSPV